MKKGKLKVERDRIKKIILWKPDVRVVAALSVILLGLLLVPLVRIAFYSAPWYDDYNYGIFVKALLADERSLKSALKGAAYCAKTQWYAWQGTYSSIFFMALVPVAWGEEYYFLGPLFLIGIFTVAVMVFVKTLAGNVLRTDRASGTILAVGVTAMTVVMIYHAQRGFYWYNSGVHYTGMHAFMLLLIAGWVKLLGGVGKLQYVLLTVWTLLGAVLAGGSNYVTSLQGFLVGLSILLGGIILRKKRTFLLVPSMFVYGIALYRNVSAPGNNIRSAIYEGSGMSTDAVKAVVNSFLEAFRFIKIFNWQMTLAVMVLLAPVIWRMVRNSKCKFCYPGILLAWSVCLYATGFTASLYVLGAVVLARVINVIQITYQILLIVNEVYWLGWACRKLEQRKGSEEPRTDSKSVPLAFFIVTGMVMLGIFAVDSDKEGHYSSWAAYHYVHTGEANEFHKSYEKRIAAIVNGGDIVRVEPYIFRPWILATEDLSDNPDAEANASMAKWYQKKAIICSFEETDDMR